MVPLLRRGTGPRISWWGALVVLWWWLSAIASFLLLQAAADSLTDLDGSCYVEPSEETVQACSWIDTCGVAGCSGSCVMNHIRMRNNIAVSSRDWDEDTWRLCPELAYWTDLAIQPRQPDVARRLQAEDGARGAHGSLLRRFARELRQLDAGHADSMGSHARARATAAEHVGGQFEFAAEHFSSRGLRQFSFEDTAPMAAPGVRFGETAPMAAPAGEQNIPEEFTLKCPTPEDLEMATSELIFVGVEIEGVFENLLHPERPPPPDPSDFEFILEQPNKYLVLMEFFKNPDKIAQYMSTNCEPRLVDFYDGGGYGRWSASIYVNTSESALAQEDVLEVCADNFGAWEEYHLNYHRININCDPAFDLNPTCYDNNTWFYVLHPSSSCVDAWDKIFNTTAPDILSQIAQVNLDAHQACTALTTEELCTSTTSPELQELLERSDNLQMQLPFKTTNPLGPAAFEALQLPQATAPDGAAPPSSLPAGPPAEQGPSGDNSAAQRSKSTSGPPSKRRSVHVGTVVGPIVGAMALVMLGVGVAVLVRKHTAKTRRQPGKSDVAGGPPQASLPVPSKLPHQPSAVQPYPDRTRGTYWTSHNLDGRTPAPQSQPAAEPQNALPSLLLPPAPPLALAMHSPIRSPTGWSQYTTQAPAPPSVQSSVQASMHATTGSASKRSTPTAAAVQRFSVAAGVGSDLGIVPDGVIDRQSQMSAKLCQELDLMHHLHQCFAQRYRLLGLSQRGTGSFGIVQPATIDRLGDAVVLKIFTNPAGFANEQRVYRIRAVADAVGSPPVLMNNKDGAAASPSGWRFPAFTVADRGKPLDAWLACYTADMLTCVQVLGQVLKVLDMLHEAGYAHRNIKPSNILQRDKQHDWMLFDFAASCPFNIVAPLPSSTKSLPYVAPELLAGVKPGVLPSAPATAAADMWALGVVAFELLTNEPLFAPGTPPHDIRAALAGRKPMPWEDGADGAERRRKKLRGLQRLVMPCLARDPQQRPAAGTVLRLWHGMFDDMKTRGTFADSFRVK